VSKIESILRYTFGKTKIMDEDSVSKNSTFFEIDESYEQDLGLRMRVPAQRKLAFNELGLGLRVSTGTQMDDEPEKRKKKCCPKSKAKVAKHTFGSLMQHMQEIKESLGTRPSFEKIEKNPEASKQNEEPTTNENEILSPPFVVDLLTQEENSLQPPTEELWATSRPDQWTRVFQARSTEGGMDFYVDQWALREVASSLLRDLTTEESQKSAAKKSGREY
jgi:hypothetical protein